MIILKVLLIIALVMPLIYFAFIMVNSVADEILEEKKTPKEKEKKTENNLKDRNRNERHFYNV